MPKSETISASKKTKRQEAASYLHAERLSPLPALLPPWYETHKRSLPWRDTNDPYAVWLSEIMLQQTRVEAVKAYFIRFRAALPDIAALASCPEEQLLKLWEGLGYYSRVRNLQKAAQLLVREHDGRLPAKKDALLKLPGIGSYTAGAIASIAFGERETAVDGNVLRVAARVCGNEQDIARLETKRALEVALLDILPAQGAGLFNQALMELGALVCVPNGAPLCADCPLQKVCAAHTGGTEQLLPVKSAKKTRRIEQRTIFILQNGDRFFIQKRPMKGLLAGLWELPGTTGHLDADAALRFVQKMGFSPLYEEQLPSAKHIFTHVEWHMQGYRFRLADDTLSPAPAVSPAPAEKTGSAQDRTLPYTASVNTELSESRPAEVQTFATAAELAARYALPSAFTAYLPFLR